MTETVKQALMVMEIGLPVMFFVILLFIVVTNLLMKLLPGKKTAN